MPRKAVQSAVITKDLGKPYYSLVDNIFDSLGNKRLSAHQLATKLKTLRGHVYLPVLTKHDVIHMLGNKSFAIEVLENDYAPEDDAPWTIRDGNGAPYFLDVNHSAR